MYLVPMNMDRRRKEEDGLEDIDDRYEEEMTDMKRMKMSAKMK